MRKNLRLCLGLCLALGLAAGSAWADDDHDDDDAPTSWSHRGRDHDHDHDRARQAVLAGEILPLSKILDLVEREFGGELIEAELETHHGRLVYEIKLVSRDGRLRRLIYDARDGTLLKNKERS